MEAHAHARHDRVDDFPLWEPLFTPFVNGVDECRERHCVKCRDFDPAHGHLNKVAWWTAHFASAMFPAGPDRDSAWRWGYLAGLWHDLGKFHPDFQRKLAGESIQIEHAGAGAAFAKETIPAVWQPLAFVIAGHRSGLANLATREPGDHLTPLDERVERAVVALQAVAGVSGSDLESMSSPLASFGDSLRLPPSATKNDAVSLTCFVRMLFSALVDADSLATERFCNPTDRKVRLRTHNTYSIIAELSERLDASLDQVAARARPCDLNDERARILEWCRQAAQSSNGIFTLNVPTGGGKTFASMAFALRHILANPDRGMRRVIVAVPFTSIIEQNAGKYAEIFGAENVIEHHSNLDDFEEGEEDNERSLRRRLACENWDAPIVVTTNVQLLESLFAHKRKRARKLHNIAGSVIILDEAQCVPVGFMALIVPMLRELAESYGCSVVICTATQPAWKRRPTLPFGIDPAALHPIIPPQVVLSKLAPFDRVDVEWPKPGEILSYSELADRLMGEPCAMAIVHRKKDALQLAKRLGMLCPGGPLFHLSTNMCPVHRRQALDQIREALEDFRREGRPCRIVTTQLIEAGVDIDVPLIFRAMAGLDSLAQAAGRANREGRMAGKGRLIVFNAETDPPDAHLQECAQVTRGMLYEDPDLDLTHPATFEAFFTLLYRGRNLDVKKLDRHTRELNFETVGREFRLIENGDQIPVVIAFDEVARQRLARVRAMASGSVGEDVADRFALRALQPYTVNLWPRGAAIIQQTLEPLFPGSSARYLDTMLYPKAYHPIFGLLIDDEPLMDPGMLVV